MEVIFWSMKWISLYDAANRQRMVQSSAFQEKTEAARERGENHNKNKQIYCYAEPASQGPCSAGRGCWPPSAPCIFRVVPRPEITLPAQDSPLHRVNRDLQRLSLLKEKQFRLQAEHFSVGCDVTFRNSEQGMLTAFVPHTSGPGSLLCPYFAFQEEFDSIRSYSTVWCDFGSK